MIQAAAGRSRILGSWVGGEPGGVPPAGRFQSLGALTCGVRGQAVVDIGGRVK